MAKKAAEARRRSIVEAVRRGASQRATARAFGVGLERCSGASPDEHAERDPLAGAELRYGI